MSTTTSKSLFLFLLSILIVCSSVLFISSLKKQVKQEKEQSGVVFHSSHRELQNIDPPITNFPTTPVTNPVTTPSTLNPPPDTPTPTIVTIPSANPSSTPITFPPATPSTNPVNPPTPVTNPVTTPSTNIPGGQPVTNPAVGPPVTTTNPPVVSGQSWCVAKSGVPETTIQSALDYACGIGGADCASIQQGAGCYNPNTLQNHASYAFNSYYQKNSGPTSCDFGGAAALTNTNPSSGSCIYSTSGSPTNPTPTTASSSGANPTGLGTPPDVLNAGNPALGGGSTGFGDISPTANGSSASMASGLQPIIGCIIVVASFIIGMIVLDI
ncbi:hypothetical protein ACJIZ3_015877 [Penstemon smallii]|uniref:X8 domain-containing protein n=1 Tax=Penstemon smallii TaxID=265156 RepID=A0ABD3RNS7_9LAMI